VIFDSVPVAEALLVLKLLFLILLYLFIWRIVRSACRDVHSSQESFILAPSSPEAAMLAAASAPAPSKLVVVKSSSLKAGADFRLDSAPLTIGRGGGNDVRIEDEFASSRHAQVEPRRDGAWVQDIGSTNGTYVNGLKLTRPRKLAAGDVVRVGETELRYET
jgi:hypothetical protein